LALVVTGTAIWEALDFPPAARFMPLLTGGPAIILILFHLLFHRQRASGEIMDIGLRSVTTPGAGRAAALLAGFLALLLLLAATVGLAYGTIAFAILFPLVMGRGRSRWIASGVAALIVALVALLLLDHYMGVLWPDTVVRDWIT
jgi:hypothetical protein